LNSIIETGTLLFHQRLVSFTAINTFKGFAEGAKVSLNLLDKPERGTLLFFTGMFANRAADADFGHFTVPVCNFILSRFSSRILF
jgi:hypothetical protein